MVISTVWSSSVLTAMVLVTSAASAAAAAARASSVTAASRRFFSAITSSNDRTSIRVDASTRVDASVAVGGVSAFEPAGRGAEALLNVGESAAPPLALSAAARAAAAARNLAFASSADVCGERLDACFSAARRAASSFWRAMRRSFSDTAETAGAFFSLLYRKRSPSPAGVASLPLDAASLAAACSSAWRLAASARAASARSRCFFWRSARRALTSSGGWTMVFPEPVASSGCRARFSAGTSSVEFSFVDGGVVSPPTPGSVALGGSAARAAASVVPSADIAGTRWSRRRCGVQVPLRTRFLATKEHERKSAAPRKSSCSAIFRESEGTRRRGK